MVIGDSVTAVKGVGEKTAESFSRLGIFTVEDLVNYYPRSYVNYSSPKDIADVSCGAREAVFAVINSAPFMPKILQGQLNLHGLIVLFCVIFFILVRAMYSWGM